MIALPIYLYKSELGEITIEENPVIIQKKYMLGINYTNNRISILYQDILSGKELDEGVFLEYIHKHRKHLIENIHD